MVSVSNSSSNLVSQNNVVSNDMVLRSGRKIKYNPALNKRYSKKIVHPKAEENRQPPSLKKRCLTDFSSQLVVSIGQFLDAKSMIAFTLSKSLQESRRRMLRGSDTQVTEILRKAKGKLDQIPPHILKDLQAKDVATSIKALDLHGIDMSGSLLTDLLALFPALTDLNLEGSNLDDSSLKALQALADLRKLNIGNNNKITPERLDLLLCHKNLCSLGLRRLGLNNTILEAITKALPGVKDLDISHNGHLTQTALQHIVKLELERLNLSWCRQITGLELLSSIKELKNLTLGGIVLNDEEMKPIVKLIGLTKLSLEDCTTSHLTEEGIQLFGSMPNLKELSLTGLDIQGNAFRKLLEHKNIITLHLDDTNVFSG